jgi:acyl-coenzyme A thioesterase PaaI-like protein
MPESVKSKLWRWAFNLHPTYRSTGAWVTYLAHDFREARVKLPLSWRTRNYVGTIFGGSIYSAVDPIYMIMLIKNLGPGYVVWDKAAAIRFMKPGRGTLFAEFVLADEELNSIRSELQRLASLDRVYEIQLTNAEGLVCAVVEKTIYIRRKHFDSSA